MSIDRSPLRSLSIGGSTYDLFLTFQHQIAHKNGELCFTMGGKMPIKSVTEACGGGAANTSVGLSRLGMRATFCGVIGSDQWGEAMLKNLQKEKVDTTSATIVEGETSSFSVILSAAQDRSILTAPGVSAHLHDVTFDADALRSADVVYLNHLSESSCVIENDIAEKLKGFSGHLTWNPGGCQIDAGMHQKEKSGLLSQTSLLLLNKEEALRFAEKASVEDTILALRSAGVRCVCITDGKHGATAEDDTGRYHCPVLPVTIVDTTGAGDAFGIGMTWALSMGLPLPKALIAGTLNASRVVGLVGAQIGLMHEEEMRTLLSTTDLTVTSLA